MPETPTTDIDLHIAALRETLHQTDIHPWYTLLIDNMVRAAEESEGKSVLILERTALYGGGSPWITLFRKARDVMSIDLSPDDGRFNTDRVSDDRLILPESHLRGWSHLERIPRDYDLILCPNIHHHIWPPRLWRILHSCGPRACIFDNYLEEHHFEPYHYGHFTRHGLKTMALKNGFEIARLEETGDAFSTAAYFLDNALQYLPKSQGQDREKIMQNLAIDLRSVSASIGKEAKNQVRKRTSTPFAYWLELARL